MMMTLAHNDRIIEVLLQEAGVRAGCKTLFIDYGYAEKQPQSFDFKVLSLREAADIILGEM